jgi:hypothetical protein
MASAGGPTTGVLQVMIRSHVGGIVEDDLRFFVLWGIARPVPRAHLRKVQRLLAIDAELRRQMTNRSHVECGARRDTNGWRNICEWEALRARPPFVRPSKLNAGGIQ